MNLSIHAGSRDIKPSNIMMIYVGLRRYDDAIQDAQMAVSSKPDVRGGYWALGTSLFASDRIQEAVAIAHIAVEHTGDDDNVFIPFILCLERAGRHDDALHLRNNHIRVLDRQLELTPDDVRARILLASNYAKLGKKEESITQLEKALALRPKDTVILYNAACTYALLDRKRETLDLLKQVKKHRLPNLDWMARDPDLNFLHGDPEFEDLFKRDE